MVAGEGYGRTPEPLRQSHRGAVSQLSYGIFAHADHHRHASRAQRLDARNVMSERLEAGREEVVHVRLDAREGLAHLGRWRRGALALRSAREARDLRELL